MKEEIYPVTCSCTYHNDDISHFNQFFLLKANKNGEIKKVECARCFLIKKVKKGIILYPKKKGKNK